MVKIFSCIGLDQNHEQENPFIKGVGGESPLLDDEKALRKWMILGPEVAQFISSLEQQFEIDIKTGRSGYHHEESIKLPDDFS